MIRIRHRLIQGLHDRRGNVATIFGLTFLPLTLFVGASIDYARALNAAAQAQAVLDSAALAGVGKGAQDGAALANAMVDASFSSAHFDVLSRSATPNGDGTFTVQAVISVPTTVMSMVVPSIDLTRSATASIGTTSMTAIGPPTCLLMLDQTMQHAFASRSNSSLDASQCDVRVNSTGTGARNLLDHWENSDQANRAAIFVSDSNFKFGSFCAVGPVQGSVPGVGPSCGAATPDPFAGRLPAVTPGACTPANTFAGLTILAPTPNATYCGTFTFAGTIPAGIYYIRTATGTSSSKLTIAGNTRGTDVTFYFVDATATLDVTGDSTRLSAPTSGPFAGYLIFTPSGLAKANVAITSLDKNNWSGVIYTPNWNIEIHSWSQDTLAAITWVSNSMVWDSESQVKVTPGPISIVRYQNGLAQLSTDPAPSAPGGSAYLIR